MRRDICEYKVDTMIVVVRVVYGAIGFGATQPSIEILLDEGSWPASACAEIDVGVVGYIVTEDAMDSFGN